MNPSLDEIRAVITKIVQEMLEEWGIGDEPVHGTSLFQANLGFSSVDALHIMASLDMRLGTKLPYEKLVMSNGEYIQDISVDALAEFAFRHFDERPAGPVAM